MTSNSITSAISVIIVNWNSGELLHQCLSHLQQQTVRPYKVIVVDNASSDGSALCTLAAGAELISMPTNLGFAAANNFALAKCDSEFVALLNPDAFPEPEWLEHLLAAAESNPDVAAFGSRQLCESDHETIDGIGDSYHMSGLVWRLRYGRKMTPDDMVSREVFSPCAAAALYRRQAVVAVDSFDEDFFCYVEDVDLGFRLRLAGYSAIYVSEAVVHHVGSATTGGRHSDFSVYHGHRNLVWAFVKNMPGMLVWLLLPLHLLMNLLTVAWFAARGQGKVIFKAKWDAFKGLPTAWRKRRHIQSHRVATVGSIWRVLDKRVFRPRND